MNREVLAVPEGRRMLFVRVTRSDLARREGLRELGWGGCRCVSDRLGAWVLGDLDAGPEFHTSVRVFQLVVKGPSSGRFPASVFSSRHYPRERTGSGVPGRNGAERPVLAPSITQVFHLLPRSYSSSPLLR